MSAEAAVSAEVASAPPLASGAADPAGQAWPARYASVERLFYCVGAQKAATTWLAEMLSAAPDCHVARGKELHYWTMRADGRTREEQLAFRRGSMVRGVRDLARAMVAGRRVRRSAEVLSRRYVKLQFARDPSDRAYIRRLMAGWRGQPVAGEMTPNYAILGEDWFRRMAAIHPDTRMFFVMRDPVDRLWSGIKHLVSAKAAVDAERQRGLLAMFDDALDDPRNEHRMMSEYQLTVDALDRSLPEDRRAYFFFDTIRSQAELDRLAGFLGVSRIISRPDRRVNEGGLGSLNPSDDQMARARHAFAPVYRFVENRFGADAVSTWRNA